MYMGSAVRILGPSAASNGHLVGAFAGAEDAVDESAQPPAFNGVAVGHVPQDLVDPPGVVKLDLEGEAVVLPGL